MPVSRAEGVSARSLNYMPVYEYRSDDGAVVERVYTMREDKPESLVEGGVTYRRVFGNCRVNDRAHAGYPYASKRLAGTAAARDCQHAVVPVGKKGHRANLPVVQSKKHERELMARHGLIRE